MSNTCLFPNPAQFPPLVVLRTSVYPILNPLEGKTKKNILVPANSEVRFCGLQSNGKFVVGFERISLLMSPSDVCMEIPATNDDEFKVKKREVENLFGNKVKLYGMTNVKFVGWTVKPKQPIVIAEADQPTGRQAPIST